MAEGICRHRKLSEMRVHRERATMHKYDDALNYLMPSWTTRLRQDILHEQTLLHSNSRGGSAKLKSLVSLLSFVYTITSVLRRFTHTDRQTDTDRRRDRDTNTDRQWYLVIPALDTQTDRQIQTERQTQTDNDTWSYQHLILRPEHVHDVEQLSEQLHDCTQTHN